ncbi:MAG: FAD-binding protein, partial [Acidimicrobiia bacterium]
MSSIKSGIALIASRMQAEIPGLPEAEFTAAPATPIELAELLTEASAKRLRVLVWGGGAHQGLGYRMDPDLIVSTARLNRLIAWEPEDMTVVAEGGATVEDLE